jgi:hypothetical protein
MKMKYLNILIWVVAIVWFSSCINNNQNDEEKNSNELIVAKVPPMGWNSFDSYGCAIYEEKAMEEVKVFIEQYAPLGYEYFVIDNGWFSAPQTVNHDGFQLPLSQHASPENVVINKYGLVQPSETFFPNGLEKLIDTLHEHGLKFGLHVMRGIPRKAVERNTPIKGTDYHAKDLFTTEDDCGWCRYMHGVDMTKPGGQEYYNSLVAQFASWGVDFLKVDHITHKPAEIEAYVKAIENSGRDIVLSLSAGGTSNKKYYDVYKKTNMVRNTPDIWDDQESLNSSFESWREWQGLEEPGFWPDLDMIPFGELNILKRPYNRDVAKDKLSDTELRFGGKMHHWCNLSKPGKETFITQRAMAASPLMIGGSLISMDEHSQNLLTNENMIECNQNGIIGVLIYEKNGIEIWHTPVKNDDEYGYQNYDTDKGWLGIFNRTDEKKTFTVSNRSKILNLPDHAKFSFHEIWKDNKMMIDQNQAYSTSIAANGVRFIKYEKVLKVGCK